jgi:hypothetical protein
MSVYDITSSEVYPNNHFRVHSDDDKLYKYEQCMECLSCKGSLVEHIRIHPRD